jgi:hypothetical protein
VTASTCPPRLRQHLDKILIPNGRWRLPEAAH